MHFVLNICRQKSPRAGGSFRRYEVAEITADMPRGVPKLDQHRHYRAVESGVVRAPLGESPIAVEDS